MGAILGWRIGLSMAAAVRYGRAMMIQTLALAANMPLRFEDLGLSPIALDLGFFTLKWYSLAYLSGILIGYWYLLKLLAHSCDSIGR